MSSAARTLMRGARYRLGLERRARVRYVSRNHEREIMSAKRTTAVCFLAVGMACTGETREPVRRVRDPAPRLPKTGEEIAPDGSVSANHERELRGAWVSTVNNGTWPSRTGLAEDAAK